MIKYLDKLIENCERAKTAKAIKEIEIIDLNNIEELEDFGNSIYIFQYHGDDVESIHSSFLEFKQTSNRSCAKINEPSKTLYVGSSTTGIKRRILQHLGEGPKKTYSLHLKCWLGDLSDISLRVLSFDEPREILQLIEDAISYDLKPAFGKKGANNK